MDFTDQKALTTMQIIDAFPVECERLVPRLIKQYKKDLKPYFRECRNVRLKYYDPVTELVLLFIVKMRHEPNEIEKAIRRLEAIDFTLHPPKDGYITPAMIEEAKRVPLMGLYDFEKIKTGFGRYSACCPFHNEKTGSFFVYPDNSYHCFGCHVSGDSIQFAREYHDMSFPEAVKYLLTQ